MSTCLTLTYRFSNDPYDDFGWLEAAVSGERFSGCSGFSVQRQDVNAFGDDLSAYPIERERPVKAAWGYEPWQGDAVAISIEITAADVRGNLEVRVWLRDAVDGYDGALPNCLRTIFTTTYADIERFRLAIAKLMERSVEKAILVGR